MGTLLVKYFFYFYGSVSRRIVFSAALQTELVPVGDAKVYVFSRMTAK
jgi:hypothetical protein